MFDLDAIKKMRDAALRWPRGIGLLSNIVEDQVPALVTEIERLRRELGAASTDVATEEVTRYWERKLGMSDRTHEREEKV